VEAILNGMASVDGALFEGHPMLHADQKLEKFPLDSYPD
jgi:hypothetical protein